MATGQPNAFEVADSISLFFPENFKRIDAHNNFFNSIIINKIISTYLPIFSYPYYLTFIFIKSRKVIISIINLYIHFFLGREN